MIMHSFKHIDQGFLPFQFGIGAPINNGDVAGGHICLDIYLPALIWRSVDFK